MTDLLSSFGKRPRKAALSGAALLLLAGTCLVPPRSAQAQVQVSAVFTQAGGFFNYNFSVRNLSAFTLADVNVATGAAAISNLAAPPGFLIVYDANGLGTNQGVVDFLADNDPATPQDFFAGTTVSGFFLRSNTNLNGAAFNALDVQGNSFNGTVTTTAVTAPEPGSMGLLAFAGTPAAATFLVRRRRRFVSSASLKG